MDDRLLSLDAIKLPSKTSKNSVDIQWLSPIDSTPAGDYATENRLNYKFDGSANLRFYTCHSDLTGNDIRQYFIEDLFRSMLIRLNLSLINIESTAGENVAVNTLVLPRRVYVNRPVFISAYQLAHEQPTMVIDSFQENFKIESLMEEDLEAAEEFPPEANKEAQKQQSSTNADGSREPGASLTKTSAYQNFVTMIEHRFGTGNAVLVFLVTSILVLLISIMLKLFT